MIEIHHGLIKKSIPYIRKNTAFKKLCCDRNNRFIKRQRNILPDRIITSIVATKQKCYCRTNKFINCVLKIVKSSRTYWSLLKGFLNHKKIPLMASLFHENRFITDFKEKAEVFNSFFAKQCSLIRNDKELPISLTYYTDNRLSTVSFSHEYVGKVILNLNPNKAPGHNNISVRMLKNMWFDYLHTIRSNF